jgi:hypothetical protein
MSQEIAQLQQSWLQAEAMADAAKREVRQLSEELQRHNAKVVDAGQVKILLVSAEQARSRQHEAERAASAAFDLLWQAKTQGQQSVHA